MAHKNYTPVDHLVKKKAPSPPPPTKEAEPLSRSSEPLKIHEVVEHEPQDAEIEPYVKTKKETAELPEEVKNAGVVAAPPAQFPSYDAVKLPLSDAKIDVGLHKPITSSGRWLAELCMYLLKKAHLTIKKIHGHLVRLPTAKK